MEGTIKRKMLVPMVLAGMITGMDHVVEYSVAEAETAIKLEDSYVKPDYVEIERLRDTKQIIVIRKEDIQAKGYTTISDVLKDVPSINVGATGMGDIDIRGQGSDQAERNIQVLLDGAPITTLVNHPLSSNYDVVPVEQIEKIEIIPGGGSVLYGSGASGGIINITTNLRSMNKKKNTISQEWTSDGYRTNFNYSDKVKENVTAEFGYSKLDRNLYFKDTYRNSDYLSAGVRYDIDKSEKMTFRFSRLNEDSKYIGNVRSAVLKEAGKDYVPAYETYTVGLDAAGHKITEVRRGYLDGARTMDSYNMSYQKELGKWSFNSDVFYNHGYYMNSEYEDKKMNHDTKGVKLKFDHAYGENNSLLIGMDLYQQTADLNYNDYKLVSAANKTYKILPLSFNYDKQTKAIYMLNNITRGKYTFTQGIRRENVDWEYDKAGNNVNGAETSNRWNTAAEISGAYHYNDTGRVYARWERGYTSPDGIQISDEVKVNGSKRYVVTGAEDEIFDLYEVGLRDKLGVSTVNLTLFLSNTDNQMNRFYLLNSNGLSMQTMNMLKTKRKGVELSLRQNFGKLTLEEGYAYLHGYSDYNSFGRNFLEQNKGTLIDWSRSGLKKVPKHKAILKANYDFNNKLAMGIKYTYFGEYNNFLSDADAADGGVMQSHSLVDIDFKYKVKPDIEWYGGITNVLNTKHYEYAGDSFATLIPGAERTYYTGIRYSF